MYVNYYPHKQRHSSPVRHIYFFQLFRCMLISQQEVITKLTQKHLRYHLSQAPKNTMVLLFGDDLPQFVRGHCALRTHASTGTAACGAQQCAGLLAVCSHRHWFNELKVKNCRLNHMPFCSLEVCFVHLKILKPVPPLSYALNKHLNAKYPWSTVRITVARLNKDHEKWT